MATAALLVHCHLDQLFSGNASSQIVVAPAHVIESVPVGTASSLAESIQVTTSPAGVLLWTARATRSANWLAIAETSGTAPGTLSLSMAAMGLGVGTYRDTVLFTVEGAGAAPTVVPVELDIVASGVHLVVTTQPTATAAGVPIAPAVEVTAEDSLGNAVATFASPITVAFGTNPAGGSLSGTASETPAGGTATFGDLRINKADTGYTLHFTAGAFSATSTPFAINAAGAQQLVFTVQPTATAAGSSISPAVQIGVEDSLGNLVTGYTGAVGIALGNNPGNAMLGGTTSEPVAGGVAGFPNLIVSRPGTGFTLVATTGTLSVTSGPFAVTAAPATKLVLATAPSVNAQSGVAVAQQPVVQLEDSSGTSVPQSGLVVSAAIAGGPAGTLSGATATTDASGKASFSGLAIAGPVGDYTLRFSTPGVTAVTSGSITLSAGAAAALTAHSGMNQSAPAGTAVSVPPSVLVTDAASNPVSGVSVTFTAAEGTVTGSSATSGATGVAAVGGWTLGTQAGPDTLRATASGLSGSPVVFTATGTSPGTGSLTVTTTTSGSSLPSGYTVSVDGGQSQAIGTTGSVTFTNLSAGSHSVALTNVAGNCAVSGSNPQTISVPSGGTATTSFSLSCTRPPTPPVVNAGSNETVTVLVYTENATFSDADNDGPWSYTIDWGDGSSTNGSIASQGTISGTHTYANLAGSYTITVTVTDSYGASGASSKTVTVVL